MLRRFNILNLLGNIINPARQEDIESLGLTMTDGSQESKLVDSSGNTLEFYTDKLGRAFINVHDGHVHDEIFNHLAVYWLAPETTLSAAAYKNTYTIDLVDSTGFDIGDTIDIRVNTLHKHKFRTITDKTGNTITLDYRLDIDHPIGSDIKKAVFNMADVAGATKANPIIFQIMANPGEVLHINRLLIAMIHSGVADDGKFGGIPALTEGLHLRVNRGNGTTYETITGWKRNQDLREDMYDVSYTDAAPAGQNGTGGRFTVLSSGAIIRLDGDNQDMLEFIIQEPEIADLIDLQIKAQGHYE